MKNSKKNLTEYIETILNGTQQEKEQLQQSFFKMADTGDLLKEYGMIGSDISVSYGVINRHNGKDLNHNLSVNNWKNLCNKINIPIAIYPNNHKDGFRVYVDETINGIPIMTVLELKAVGKDNLVNDVKTVFAKDISKEYEKPLYQKKGLAYSVTQQSSNISQSILSI